MLLVVLTNALSIKGGVVNLFANIEISDGFHNLFQDLVKCIHCGLWSNMHPLTLSRLLQRILPLQVLKGSFTLLVLTTLL